MKKLFALLLVLTMVLSMSATAFAAAGGSITINNAKDGETYKIYKLLDLSLNSEKGAFTYTLPVNSAWEDFVKTGKWFKYTESTRLVEPSDALTEDSKYEFAAEVLAYADQHSEIDALQEKEAANNTVTFDNLDMGYYFIDTTVGTAVIIETNNVNLTVNDKSAGPRVDKMVEEDNTKAWGNSNTATVLQDVNYMVEISAIQGLHHVDLRDTMSAGLTFDPTSVKVYRNTISDETLIEGETNPGVIGSDGTWYLVDQDHASPDYGAEHLGSHTFHIHFRDKFTAGIKSGEKIIVTYSAKLNSNAVIGNEGNPNEVKLGYGNNQEVIGDTVKTFTWELPILKYTKTSTNPNTPLAGAKFIVIKDRDSEKQDAYVKAVDENGVITNWTYTREEAYQFVSGEDGKIRVAGLDSDKYLIEEIEAPEGYNLLTAPIAVTISEEGVIRDTIDQILTEVSIENKTGSELPSTGGFGTTMLITVGLLGVMFFGVLIVTNKRMKKEGY